MRERGFPGSLVEANLAGMIAATLNWGDFTLPWRKPAILRTAALRGERPRRLVGRLGLVLRGVIFDFDGVLVDSEYAHFEALRRVLLEGASITIDHAEYLQNYLGYDDHTCFRRAFEIHGGSAAPARIADLASMKWQVYGEGLGLVPFLAGSRELVLALHGAGVPMAIASGSRRHEIETLLIAHDLFKVFRGIVSADDVSNFKPHPEPYLRARAILGAADSARGVVALEDSVAGIASARAASLRVIGVCNSHPREKLALAHRVVDSLVDLSVADVAAVAQGLA